MIRFFRKIRQNLLSESKTGKYLKYAFGEILLVMIGILLALQVNNWNEKNKTEKLKNGILTSLNTEFKKNLYELDYAISASEEIIAGTNSLLFDLYNSNSNSNKFMGEKLDSILQKISNFPIWERSVFNIDIIQNSSGFNQSEDPELMDLVYSWKTKIESLEGIENKGQYAFQYYVDYIKKRGSWKEIDKYMLKETKGSKIMPSNDHLLLDAEFENCINELFIWNTHKKDSYEKIRLLVEDIIEYTERK